MSAIFMSRHRFSTINPDDIARIGRSLSLNSIKFKPISEDEDEFEDDDEDEETSADEEKKIGTSDDLIKRRRSTKTRPVDSRTAAVRRLKRRWSRISQRYGLKHVVPILLLLLYSVIGALMFSAVELPYAQEKRTKAILFLEANRRWVADSIINSFGLNNNSQNYDIMLNILQHSDANNSLPKPEELTWNIWGGLFYVGTIYTTIGYGNIYPETTLGYALTIIYAFFGVPLVLAILSDIGQLLAYYSSRGWRNVMSRLPDIGKKKPNATDIVMPESGVPVTLCLLLTFSWLLMCSALFCLWEKNWTYFKAFYFFFISLSTIGLGDVVPEEPKLMIFNFGLVIIGLCLVSMTLGVVQEHISLFLYRMMIELQKECEILLANGDDVDKSELLEKIWEKQPWFVKKFMPAFINEQDNQRLEEFAGATLTDTAVEMGIIPAPPGYRPSTLNLSPVVHAPIYLPPGAAIVSAPLAMISEAKMKPKVQVMQPRMQQGHAPSPLLGTLMETQRQSSQVAYQNSMESLYPGGRAVVRRPSNVPVSGRLISADQAQERLQRALRTRLASTQTPASFPQPSLTTAAVQTDLSGSEMVEKKETLSNLSLASWYEDDELSPFNLGQMQKLNAEDLRRVPGIEEAFNLRKISLQKQLVDQYVQTDDQPESVSISSSDSDIYVSALETRSYHSTRTPRFLSKFVQTTPSSLRWPSQIATSNVEVQTIVPNRKNVEIQTSSTQRSNVEIQCDPSLSVDEEAQTAPEWQQAAAEAEQANRYSRPDLLPRHWSAEEAMTDKCSQTVCATAHDEKEVQTVATKTQNLEMQTDLFSSGSVETQTDFLPQRGSMSQRGSTSDGGSPLRVRIRSDVTFDDTDSYDYDDYQTPPQAKLSGGGWSYSSWVANPERDRLNSLHSVPEADQEDEDESEDEDNVRFDDAGDGDEDENNDTSLTDLHAFTEDSETATSDGGANLPAITAKVDLEDEATMDEGMTMDEDGRRSSRSSRRSKSSLKKISIKEEIITAAIATQTEELITRRQSFPKDVFTSKIRDPKVVFSDEVEKQRSHSLFRWIHRKRPSKENLSIKEKEKSTIDLHKAPVSTEEIGVQTDCSQDTRDIMIQTDESYLRKAKKFEDLRSHRTNSLAVAVAPHLKQRLSKMAAAVSAASGGAGASSASGDKKSPKKITPPKK